MRVAPYHPLAVATLAAYAALAVTTSMQAQAAPRPARDTSAVVAPTRRGEPALALGDDHAPKRPCEVAVFLNGVRTTLDWVYTIPNEELDAIDIYHALERLPLALREPDATCGAVMFWTTRGVPGWQPQPGD